MPGMNSGVDVNDPTVIAAFKSVLFHPGQAGARAVRLRLGVGSWLLAALRRGWSRLAGLAGVGWGLVVWVFGESCGGVFAPGLTWLFGAPGAVLIYVVAGALIALPE